MSDDDNGDGRSFEDEIRDALEPSEFLDKPPIENYLDLGSDSEYYERAWDNSPVEDMSEGQLWAFSEMLADAGYDLDNEGWEEMLADMLADFWEWWEEHYGK